MDERLYQLYQQRMLNDKYQVKENTVRTPLYTKRINDFKTPYVITNQFDKNTGLSLFQANTQNLAYDNIVCQKPPQEGASRYNYAIDNYITNRYVDVSGTLLKNSELRLQPNLNTTPAKIKALSNSLDQSYREYYDNSVKTSGQRSYSYKSRHMVDKYDPQYMYLLPKRSGVSNQTTQAGF